MNLCQTISEIKKTLLENEEEFSPCSEEDIQKALDYFGELPALLLDYYRTIGETPATSYYVMPPLELIERNPNFEEETMIYLGGDDCFSLYVYFRVDERCQDNPSLWADNMEVDEDEIFVDEGYISGEDFYQKQLHGFTEDEICGLPRFRNLAMYLTSVGTPLT